MGYAGVRGDSGRKPSIALGRAGPRSCRAHGRSDEGVAHSGADTGAQSAGKAHPDFPAIPNALSESHDLSDDPRRSVGLWVWRNVKPLAELEGRWEELTPGSTLLHCGLCANNIVLGKNRAFIVDWAGACIRPA